MKKKELQRLAYRQEHDYGLMAKGFVSMQGPTQTGC
jgi:hypothetical protein